MNNNAWLDDLAEQQMRRDWCITLPGGHHDLGDEDDLPDTRGFRFVRVNDIPESASFGSENPEMLEVRIYISDAEAVHADDLVSLMVGIETVEERLRLFHSFYRRETGSLLDGCLCDTCRVNRRPIASLSHQATEVDIALLERRFETAEEAALVESARMELVCYDNFVAFYGLDEPDDENEEEVQPETADPFLPPKGHRRLANSKAFGGENKRWIRRVTGSGRRDLKSRSHSRKKRPWRKSRQWIEAEKTVVYSPCDLCLEADASSRIREAHAEWILDDAREWYEDFAQPWHHGPEGDELDFWEHWDDPVLYGDYYGRIECFAQDADEERDLRWEGYHNHSCPCHNCEVGRHEEVYADADHDGHDPNDPDCDCSFCYVVADDHMDDFIDYRGEESIY